MTLTTTDRWVYSGDCSLEHSGAYIDLSTWNDGYCEAVRITALDSGCGFTGACMIEHIVINGTTDSKRIREALKCVGYDGEARNWHAIGERNNIKKNLRHLIADAIMRYGFTDPDDSWDRYSSHHTETIQMEANGPMKFDGWKADKRLRGTDLKSYVESQHLKY